MEPIKQWFLSLCGATAITGIFHVFLSNTNFKKAINVFLSVFVLFYTIFPLSNMEKLKVNFLKKVMNRLSLQQLQVFVKIMM